jgi:hypothetical protein
MMRALDCLGDGNLMARFARDAMSSIFLNAPFPNTLTGYNNGED